MASWIRQIKRYQSYSKMLKDAIIKMHQEVDQTIKPQFRVHYYLEMCCCTTTY